MNTIALPVYTAQVLGFTTQIPARELGGLVYPDPEFFRNHHAFISSGVDTYINGSDGALRVFNTRNQSHYYLLPADLKEGAEVVVFRRTISVYAEGREVGGVGGFLRLRGKNDPLREIVARVTPEGAFPGDARVKFVSGGGSWAADCCYQIARVCQ